MVLVLVMLHLAEEHMIGMQKPTSYQNIMHIVCSIKVKYTLGKTYLMIKIKLSQPDNMKCFAGLLITRDLLKEYSIDITASSDYDYEFIDTSQFVDLRLHE